MLFPCLPFLISVYALSISYVESRWIPKEHLFPNEYDPKGDMRIPRSHGRMGRSILRPLNRRWPRDRPIPYEINPAVSKDDARTIREALAILQDSTCLRFRYRESRDIDYIHFTNEDKGCYATWGKFEGKNIINLQSPGCVSHPGTAVHEVLHTLGFNHEHNRSDRDKYITINWDYVVPESTSQFDLEDPAEWDNQFLPYDLYSIMHYNRKAFSSNGTPTIELKHPFEDTKAWYDDSYPSRLTHTDLKRIRLAYCVSESEARAWEN